METKQAILYFRTSGEQKADCEAYCKANGLEIVNTFCDDGMKLLGKTYVECSIVEVEHDQRLFLVKKRVVLRS